MHTGDAEQHCSEVVYCDNETQDDHHDDVHEEVGVLFKVAFIYNDSVHPERDTISPYSSPLNFPLLSLVKTDHVVQSHTGTICQ